MFAARLASRAPSLAALAALAAQASAQVDAADEPVQHVVVTGSVRERVAAEAPYAITVIDADTLRAAGPGINLSEALVRVPGLVVNNRNNYAQDLQMSSRGFGARSSFGVRGLRLYSDGIPATMPDGQGQVAHFDIAGAERIEVLRGPFSALYGNSSGGVIALFSAPVTQTSFEGGLDVGSFGLRQLRASAQTPLGNGFDVRAGASWMETDGFRPHAGARRRTADLRVGWQREADSVIVRVSAVDQPAQDPLGLTREQFDADPTQTAPQATEFDTRKTARQTQAGENWRHRFDAGALRESRLLAYAGSREVTQWLAISRATQANPPHGGGVVDFDRRYGGIEGRLTWGWQRVDAVAGVALETQRDDRHGFENFSGPADEPELGVTGRLRRDEDNRATTRDAFAQVEWTPLDPLTLSGGVRSGQLRLSTTDGFLSNGNDSGALRYSYTNPVLGVRWQVSPALQWHASAARAFESPTLGELAYRADGEAGFNDRLRPQRSRQLEIGAKWRAAAWDVDGALFQAEVDDEIGVQTNAGGRSTFQNVGRTRRRGVELAATWHPSPAWRAQWVASRLDARLRDGFLSCAALPCLAPDTPVAAGRRIAGTQRASAFAELAWRSAALGEWGLEWRGVGRTAVNDRNTEFAPGYGIAALRWRRAWSAGGGTRIETLLRIDNVTDRNHVGSVIVNDGNGRYDEPGAPRSVLVQLRVVGAP